MYRPHLLFFINKGPYPGIGLNICKHGIVIKTSMTEKWTERIVICLTDRNWYIICLEISWCIMIKRIRVWDPNSLKVEVITFYKPRIIKSREWMHFHYIVDRVLSFHKTPTMNKTSRGNFIETTSLSYNLTGSINSFYLYANLEVMHFITFASLSLLMTHEID